MLPDQQLFKELVAATSVLLTGLATMSLFAFVLYRRRFFLYQSIAWLLNLLYLALAGLVFAQNTLGAELPQIFASVTGTIAFWLALRDVVPPLRHKARWVWLWAGWLAIALGAPVAFAVTNIDVLNDPVAQHAGWIELVALPGILASMAVLGGIGRRLWLGAPPSLLALLRGSAAPSLAESLFILGAHSSRTERTTPEDRSGQPQGRSAPKAVLGILRGAQWTLGASFALYAGLQPLYLLKFSGASSAQMLQLFFVAFLLKCGAIVGLALLVYADFLDVMDAIKQKSEMSLLGAIAASVEHDVRNPLANLKKHIATMRLSYQHNSEVQGDLPFLEEQCRRIEAATDLIPSVRAAPEYYAQHNKRWNIVEVMRSALKLAAAAMDAASAEVEVVEPKRALFVIAYRERLLQAFVNILNNAAEACVAAPAGRRARIEVRVRPSPDGREVVMSVRDNGVGVAPERIPYLTSPFVSTKAGVRENRGIGLFISSRIIEQAGGRLEFDSDGQSFTEVHVHLALAEDDGGAQAKGPERRAR